MKKRIFSGMRPTGKLHLGHLVGALENWVKLQQSYNCVFGIVDWHAFMGEYEYSKAITENVFEMAVDWMASGIDPEQSIVFVQSQVPEHLELAMIFSCLTPLGWLERNPTYKEQLREISTRDLQTYGFLGYPVLQAADILVYKGEAVPIGEDQLPHLELTREIARRFNHIFKKQYFKDCEAILTKTPRLSGLDGRKMSKSYNNAINLSDSEEEILKKVNSMVTDPKRVRRNDPGTPEDCNVYRYYEVFASSEEVALTAKECRGALRGCTDCKKCFVRILTEYLQPVSERRKKIEKQKTYVYDVLEDGKNKAKVIAEKTLQDVKELIF